MFAALALTIQTISFHPGVAPLKVIIPLLAKQTGLELRVAPDIEWRLLYIRTEKANQRDLFDEIARASQGVWTQSNGQFTLKRDQGLIDKSNRLKVAERRQKLKEAYESNRRNPELRHQFAAATVDAIGLDRLAALPVGRKFVFTTRPSGSQLPLPPFPDAFTYLLLNSANKGRAEAVAYLQASQRDFEVRQMQLPATTAAWERRSRDLTRTETLREMPPIAILELYNLDDPKARLSCYSDEGMLEISVGSFDFVLRSQGDSYRAPGPPRFDSVDPVRMPPEYLTGQDIRRRSDGARKAILAIGERDRLLEGMTAYFDSLTTLIPGNLVIAVQDEGLGYISPGIEKGRMLSALYRAFVVTERPNWTTISPPQPIRPVNRALLADALTRLASPKRSIEDWAWVSANFERIGEPSLSYPFATFLKCLRIDESEFYRRAPGQQSLLKVYGLMTPGQQASLRAGGTLRVREFTPEQRRLLSQIKRDTEGYVESSIAGIRMKSDPTLEEQARVRNALMDSLFYGNQFTIQMPDGYPKNGVFRLSIENGSEYNFQLEAGYYQVRERYHLSPPRN